MSDPFLGNNFYNAAKGYLGLFGQTNKARKGLEEDDADSKLLPEFTSALSDEQINKLVADWTSSYDSYATDIKQQQKDNVNYWIGKQYNELQYPGTKRPLVDNLLFEALETFLPIATRGNPEPNVFADGNPRNEQIAKTIQKALLYQANRQRLRMKLKAVTRNWALYLIGVVKVGWDPIEGDIETEVVLPSHMILDPNAKIDVGGIYRGEFLGQKRKITAKKLAQLFPSKKAIIEAKVQGSMGTKITYIEWWTRTDLFFTLDSTVLGKFKNPHWNYSGVTTTMDPETGAEIEEEVKGINHFNQPEFPFLFLTIFNLGKRPHDETSLISQNIAIQDNINKRYQQIDKNVDSQNNGIVLSGKSFTKEQAAEAATQLARGNALYVPDGNINDSYARDTAPALPVNVFQQLEDSRGELRNIFGTAGSSADQVSTEKTVRGKILRNQLDSSRIGGGVTEFIEQLSASLYNWYLQMMYVYYTDEHTFSILGMKSQELMTIKNADFQTRFYIEVKDGSLIPKDPLTKRNEAIDLWAANAIDPISLYQALDDSNPYESAKRLVMWKMIDAGKLPPNLLFPDFPTDLAQALPNNTSPGITPGEADAELNRVAQQDGYTGQGLMQDVPIDLGAPPGQPGATLTTQ